MLTNVAVVLCLVLSGPAANALAANGAAQTGQTSAPAHGKEFWEAIAKDQYKIPPGQSAPQLAHELSALLGSPDPDLRDEIAYSAFDDWIYGKKLLTPADLQPLIAEWVGNLSRNIGSVGNDSVLRRSFSALVLSVVVARDNAEPFLSEKEFRTIIDAAIAYDGAEKDLRGYDPEKGWMHSAAHTADLLKFLGRIRYIKPADQAAILSAVGQKVQTAGVVFSFGEDERMARTLLSIVARPDFDQEGFRKWLTANKPAGPKAEKPQLAELAAYQNSKNLLTKLEVLLLALPPDAPYAKETAAGVQETIKGTF